MTALREVAAGIEGAFLIGANLALWPLLRGWRLRWGATGDEVQRVLPGDELVPHPKWLYTHAITVRATAAKVWPWLAQMGQGRGGFYSYEFLENLVGCDIHNADRIMPEFQNLQVGDGIKLAPSMLGFPAAIVEPGRAILLHADTRVGSAPVPTSQKPGDYFATTWVFFLDEQSDGTTRLITRSRYDYNDTLANRLMYGTVLVEPISCVMQRKMLLGIKLRAEAKV
jgi:hypothetical protein